MSGRNATHTARGSRALRSLQLVSAAALAAIPGAAASAQYVFDDTTTSATAQGTLNAGGLYGQVYTSFPNQRFNVGGNALNPGAFNVPANPLFHPGGFLTLQTQLNNSSPTAAGGTAFSNVPFSNPDNSNTYGAGAPFGGTNTTIMQVATIDDLTARWSGYFNATAAGTFTFSTRSDDGSVVYVDGVRMNGFGGNNAFQGATTRGGTINLSAGLHEIVVAFFEGNGGAGVSLHNNLTSAGNANVIPVMSGTNQILLGVQNTPLASGSNVTLAGSAPATLAVQGALVTQFGDLTVTSPNASLVLQGTTGRFNNTIINTGGPATVTLSGATNSAFAQDFYLGALNDNGNATTINNGRNTLILDNTATANTAGSTTFNVNGGGMVLVGAAAGQDPAGGAAINLNAAPNSNVAVAILVLSSKTGTALFPSRINVTDNAVIGSYQFGSSGTGVTTALTNPNGLAVPAGKTLTIGSDQGNTLRIDGPISGPGTLRVANAVSGRTANVPTGNVTLNAGTNVSDLSGNVIMNQGGTLTIASPVQLGAGSQFVMNTTNNTASSFPANVSALAAPTVTATSSVVGGNLYIANGTYNANAPSSMRFGSITTPAQLGLGAHVINYNANNAAGTQNTNLNVTASGGTAGLNLNLSNNVTSLGGDTFTVGANNIIGVSGTTVAPLLNRAPGGNLVLSPNAILAANSAAALAAVQNLGTDSDIYAGLNATWGSPQNITIGPGTPFKGLSVDRSDRRYAGGTVTLTGPAEIHSFNGYNGAGTNQVTFGSFGGRLQLGNGTNAGIFNMVSSDGTSRHPVTLTGYTFLQNGGAGLGTTAQANLSNLNGVSKFIVSPGAILQTDTTNAFGGAGGTAKPTVEVMPGGLIDPGVGNTNVGTLTGSLNTDVLLHPGATMLVNDNGNFASADGVITGAAGTIYRVEGTGQPFLGQQQGTGSVPGSIVRLSGSNFQGFDAAFDDGVVLVTRGGDRTIVTDWGINGQVTGPAADQIAGVLTNDDASRRFSSGITGSSNVATINVGPLGATFAATNNGTSLTTFTIGNSATNLSRLNVIGPSGKVTIGSPVAIDGFTKNGTVVWTGQNTNGGPMAEWNTGAVDVVSGNFQHAGGGATYNVGGASGTGITRIFSGAAFDVNTGIQINTTAQIDSGGTLRMRGSGNGNSTISGISGAGSLVLGSGATNVAGVTVTVGANNESTTFSGLISSNFGTNTTNLTKTGAGTLTLTGANTYRGTTSVGAGTLLVNNTAGSGTGAGPVTVASGATVGGTGNVGANLTTALVNVATGGNLSPGSGGVGTLTVTNANANPGTGNGATALLASGSNFNADLDFGGGVYDQLKVLGTVQLDGSNLNILATGTPLGTETITLVDNDAADAVGGTFAGRPEGSVVDIFGTPYTLTYAGGDGNDVVLVGVPEPGAIGALGLAAAAALMRRRRRG